MSFPNLKTQNSSIRPITNLGILIVTQWAMSQSSYVCVSLSQDAMIQKVTIPVTYISIHQVHSLIFETDPVKHKRDLAIC